MQKRKLKCLWCFRTFPPLALSKSNLIKCFAKILLAFSWQNFSCVLFFPEFVRSDLLLAFVFRDFIYGAICWFFIRVWCVFVSREYSKPPIINERTDSMYLMEFMSLLLWLSRRMRTFLPLRYSISFFLLPLAVYRARTGRFRCRVWPGIVPSTSWSVT